MRKTLFLALVSALLVCGALIQKQAEPRMWARYQIVDVADHGDTVRATLAVRLANYGDADLERATLLMKATANLDVYGSAEYVSVRKHETQNLDLAVELPKAEFDRLKKGGIPVLVVEYTDAEGNQQDRTVDIGIGAEER